MEILKYSINDVDIVPSSKSTCDNCALNKGKFFTVKTNNNRFCACELCKSVLIYDKLRIGEFVMGKSNLSQEEIFKRTFDYYNKHSNIPTLPKLDTDIKFISENHAMTIDTYFSSEEFRSENDDLKLFITPKFNIKRFFPTNIFVQRKPTKAKANALDFLDKTTSDDHKSHTEKYVDKNEINIIKKSKNEFDAILALQKELFDTLVL